LLTLTAPEMTVLIGGLRAININTAGSQHGVLTQTRQADERLLRQPAGHGHAVEASGGRQLRRRGPQDRRQKWTGTRVDLVFGSNAILRAVAEVYAEDGNEQKFVRTSSPPGPR
jgi:catalase-peroxidase